MKCIPLGILLLLTSALVACYPSEKKAETVGASATADTAYLREHLKDPTPKDSVTEFGSSEGDADKDIKTRNN